MQITKCDICKNKIDDKKEHVWVWLRGENWGNFELCGKCGAPVVKLLKKKKLVRTLKK